MTARDVLKLCEQKKVEFIDLRFMDFPGLWQHTTLPVSELTLYSFEHGFGFDGSSIRGWQAINESDMLLVPVPDTAKIDPFLQHTTVQMICDVRDPITKKEYSRDPRSIARKATAFLKKTKLADTAYFGPELEFFVFDNAFYDQGINYAKYYVGSREGIWGRGDEDPAKHPQRDGGNAHRAGHSCRGPSSRSRHRRAVRDRHALPGSGDDGRQRDAL
jgi:glutamine synthetase